MFNLFQKLQHKSTCTSLNKQVQIATHTHNKAITASFIRRMDDAKTTKAYIHKPPITRYG